MSTDQKKIRDDLRQWFDAFNARNLDEVDRLSDEIYTSDRKLHQPGLPELGHGASAVKQLARRIIQDDPDMQMTLKELFGEGDRLAGLLICCGRTASTGQQVSFPVLWISRYDGDKCVEDWQLVGPPE